MDKIDRRDRRKIIEQYDKIYELEFEKLIEARIAEFDENIIFTNMIALNGIPKKVFLKCLKPLTNTNEISNYEKAGISITLESIFDKLEDREVNSHIKIELLITIRKLLYHEITREDTINWFLEQQEDVNEGFFVSLYEGNNKCLQQEVCFTVAYLAYKLRADFSFYAEETINSFLLMLSQWLQSYDLHLSLLRRKRTEYNDRKLITGINETFIYPRMVIPCANRCHMEVSSCLYALSFVLYYSDSPEIIMTLLHETTTRKEMSRYFLIQILYTTIFNLTRMKIKENRQWRMFPKQFYFEVSRLYADSNLAVRKLVREMMDHLHKISVVKLPLMEGRLVEQLEKFQLESRGRQHSRVLSESISSSQENRGRRKTEILPNLAQLLPFLNDKKSSDERSEESNKDELQTFLESIER